MFGRIVSIRLEVFGLPVREAIGAAARLGVDKVEFDAVGVLSARELSRTGRRELRHLLRSHNLGVSGLGFPTRSGYDELDRLDGRIEATGEALRLAYDLGAPIVINQIGKIPDNSDGEAARAFREALLRVANDADRAGSRLAIQTGLDSPERLAEFLEGIGSHGLAVNYAPANLLIHGVDLATGIERLSPWLAGCHVRDVVRSGLATVGVRDVPLGRGEIDWSQLFGTFGSIDYQGAFTIVRSPGTETEELVASVEFVRG